MQSLNEKLEEKKEQIELFSNEIENIKLQQESEFKELKQNCEEKDE